MHLTAVALISFVGFTVASADANMESGDPEDGVICQNFYPDVPYSSELLPSEIPTMSCKCVGVSEGQACPRWTFLEGLENATIGQNETKRESEHSCTSYFRFALKPNITHQANSYNFKLKCEAEIQRKVLVTVKKALNTYRCNEDEDCALENQRCVVRGPCPGNDCSKICQCPEEKPIYIPGSPENCYPKLDFGESCNYTVQCQYSKPYRVLCITEEAWGNDTQGVCRCPAGYSFNGQHQDCLVVVIVPPKQSLTERIMIAVCCGIVGIFIFVFVSYICKRHIRHLRRRQSHHDHDHALEEASTLPLNSKPNLPDKPPSYQESQEAGIPVRSPVETLPEGSSSPNEDPERGVLPMVTVTPSSPPSQTSASGYQKPDPETDF